MPSKLKKSVVWNLASVALLDGFTDFILSRQAMNCTLSTLQFYRFPVGVFLAQIESQGVRDQKEVTALLPGDFLFTAGCIFLCQSLSCKR